jgi:hypothetical protein
MIARDFKTNILPVSKKLFRFATQLLKDEDEVVRFLAKDAGNGKISDLLLVVGGDDNTLISISGIIDPENIGKITGALNIDVGGKK